MKSINVPFSLNFDYYGVSDLETTPIEKGKQKFILGGFYHGGHLFYYSNRINELIDYMINSKRKIIYFHNLSYDVRFFLDYLIDNYQVSIIPNNNDVLAVKVYEENRKIIEFRDSYSLIPLNLKDATHKINLLYEKREFDFSKKYTAKQLLEYLMYDCLSLYELLIRYKKLMGVKNELPLTLPCLTLNLWKKNYKSRNIEYLNSFDWLFMKSYYGSRVEVFKRKCNNAYYYDFNSLYPHVMKNNYYPVGKMKKIRNEEELSQYEFYIAHCEEVNIPKMNIPPIPYRNKKGFLSFPYGKLKDVIYNSVDLNLLLENEGTFKIKYAYVWSDEDKIFDEYIHDAYKLKIKATEENNDALYLISKLKMNSLYGKFAQRKEKFNVKQLSDKEFWRIYDKGKHIESLKFSSNIFMIKERDYYSPSTSHISGFITSYARKELFNVLNECELKGNVYYCDTDSVITDVILPHHKYNLGQLKLEFKIKEGYFALPKLYALKLKSDKVVIKSKGLDVKSIKYNMVKDFVENNNPIKNKSIRISKMKSYLKGHRDIKECYELERVLKVDAINNKRTLINKYDTVPKAI